MTRIFYEPSPFRHEYGCVGVRDKYLSPWCIICADDIVLCSTRREEVEKKLRQGLNISRKKTVYNRFNVHRNLDGNSDINLNGDNLERVTTFKYLGSTFAENGDLDAKMTNTIQSGQDNWKRESGVLCDRRISLRVKGDVYKTIANQQWCILPIHGQ